MDVGYLHTTYFTLLLDPHGVPDADVGSLHSLHLTTWSTWWPSCWLNAPYGADVGRTGLCGVVGGFLGSHLMRPEPEFQSGIEGNVPP